MTSNLLQVSRASLRSHALDLTKYNTDKIPNGFLSFYDPIFSPLTQSSVNLLELGVLDGGALQLWRDYFPTGKVLGIDRVIPAHLADEERILLFEGEQDDLSVLDQAGASCPEGFDFIIDDASHVAAPTRTSFWHLFDNYLKPGGWYFIEDWGTGYWENWPDGQAYRPGQNHAAGMVGFVKSLVDEVGAHDRSRAWYDQSWTENSRFAQITFVPAIAAIQKRIY